MQLGQNRAPPATPWNVARSPFIRYPGQGSPSSVVAPLKARATVRAKRELVEWMDKQNPEWIKKAEEIVLKKSPGAARNMTVAPNNGTLGYTPLVHRYSQDMNVRRRVMEQGLGQATPGIWAPPPEPTTTEEAATEESWLDKVIGAATTIAPAYLQFKQQKEILDMQLERAKQGLPPLETAYLAPTVRIQPELSPEALRTAREGITTGIQNVAVPALLIGGLVLLTMGGRRRRR